MSLSLAEMRLMVSPGAVLSVSRAARILGWGGAGAWLRRSGLVRLVDGQERVIWREVLRHIEQVPEEPTPQARRLPRVKL